MSFVRSAYRNVGKGMGGRRTKYVPAVVSDIEIEPQRNNWSCGPVALRYCFARFGRDILVADIIEAAQSTRAGTGEVKLQYATHRFGFNWYVHTKVTAAATKRTVDNLLKRGHALILCTEKWQHWVACMHHDPKRGYLIFDSSRPGPVIQVHGWKWLKKRLRYVPEPGMTVYYFASIKPVQESQ